VESLRLHAQALEDHFLALAGVTPTLLIAPPDK
jgi:hypothetical protein